MRRLRYSVAMSLDGYIADADGAYDWIIHESAIDFHAYLAKIDTLIMGRGTWEIARAPEAQGVLEGMRVFVASTTLPADTDPRVSVIADGVEDAVHTLKAEPGRDIWLFGGGVLFRSLLDAGLVDRVEVAVIPVLLGEGVPLLPGAARRHAPIVGDLGVPGAAVQLRLHSSEVFDSGIVLLKYDVPPEV